MAGFCEVIREWVGVHIKLCKILSACLVVVALALIIGGAVLVAQNKGGYNHGSESFNQFTDRQELYNGGIAMIMLGIFLLVCSVVSFCFAFQLKFVGNLADSLDNRQRLNGGGPRSRYDGQSPSKE